MNQKINNNNTKSVKAVFILVTILAVIQVLVSNQLVAFDTKFAHTVARSNLVEQENEDLYQKVASRSAFLSITSEAEKLGLVKTTRYFYLNQNQKIALEYGK